VNQAAPQNHFDVGTNIVFNGVKSEGGIRGIRKHHAGKKGLVGSTFVQVIQHKLIFNTQHRTALPPLP
jgi:hypothetical protein